MKAELEGFAGCGDFERTCCRSCGDELRVAFSCKSRGCCPSCMGRRMAEGAALLVDHVLPAAGGLAMTAVRLDIDGPSYRQHLARLRAGEATSESSDSEAA